MIFSSSATIGSGALNQKNVAAGISAHHSWLERKAVEQFHQGLGRNILQRDNRNAVAGLRRRSVRVNVAGADGVSERNQAITDRLVNEPNSPHAQRALQHVEDIELGDR